MRPSTRPSVSATLFWSPRRRECHHRHVVAEPAPRHAELLKAVSKGPVKDIILLMATATISGASRNGKSPALRLLRRRIREISCITSIDCRASMRAGTRRSFRCPYPRSGLGGQLWSEDARHDSVRRDLQVLARRHGFRIFHTPGETPDHLTVWIPRYKAVFPGDNYYDSFPNMYTLRGTTPRWALEYVSSLNKVMALKPETCSPSHGQPVKGNAEISGE